MSHDQSHLKNCLAKESASLNIPCSDESLKLRELAFPDEVSNMLRLPPGVESLMALPPGEGAPLRVKFRSNPWEKFPWKGGKFKK